MAVISFLALWPALGNQFVDWDDDANFLENYGYRGFGAEQLRWMFTQPMMGHYHPLTWITSAVDYSIWGLNPFGYHLGNLVLHALNAAWFYVLALILLPMVLPAVDRRGGFAIPLGAAFAALLFGVHPLRVESVAWATERRDVLSTFFLLPCLICYLRHTRSASGRRKWYLASVGLLLLSLLSKAWGITLPMVLLVLDFHPLRRLHWRWPDLISPRSLRVYLEKVPFALLAAGAAYKAA